MNNEQYDQIAKDFCIANGFDTASFRRFVKFAKDLIDNGVLVEADVHQSLKNEYQLLVEKYNFTRDEQEEDRQQYAEHLKELESTISSAGKEVKTSEEILSQWDGLPLGSDDTEWYSRKAVLRAMDEHADQFKSSPACTEIPKDVIERIAVDYSSKNMIDKNVIEAIKETAKWYREQLTTTTSDNDITIEALKLFPLGESNYGEREAWIAGAKKMRDGL